MAVPYGTDAGPLSQTGVPCVVFGPGDIAHAHTCDEWVPLDEKSRRRRRFCIGWRVWVHESLVCIWI